MPPNPMTERHPNEEQHRLAEEARARALHCPATLDDWEEKVADKWCQDGNVLAAIQVIDLDFRSGVLGESEAIELLKRLETSAEDESGRCRSPMVQPWFFSAGL